TGTLALRHNLLLTSIRLVTSLPQTTVKTPEQEAALRSIRKLIEFWRISPDELWFEAPVAPAAASEAPPPPTHRYRHPLSGESWNGEGSQPQWLREALT